VALSIHLVLSGLGVTSTGLLRAPKAPGGDVNERSVHPQTRIARPERRRRSRRFLCAGCRKRQTPSLESAPVCGAATCVVVAALPHPAWLREVIIETHDVKVSGLTSPHSRSPECYRIRRKRERGRSSLKPPGWIALFQSSHLSSASLHLRNPSIADVGGPPPTTGVARVACRKAFGGSRAGRSRSSGPSRKASGAQRTRSASAGAAWVTRTPDPRITNALLYRLS
jgi:hypothetical protein